MAPSYVLPSRLFLSPSDIIIPLTLLTFLDPFSTLSPFSSSPPFPPPLFSSSPLPSHPPPPSLPPSRSLRGWWHLGNMRQWWSELAGGRWRQRPCTRPGGSGVGGAKAAAASSAGSGREAAARQPARERQGAGRCEARRRWPLSPDPRGEVTRRGRRSKPAGL